MEKCEQGHESSSRRGLWPPQKAGAPGRNPKGNNQYTYRRNFERAIDRYLKGTASPEDIGLLPQNIRSRIKPEMTTGEALAVATVVGAFTLNDKHLEVVLKRVWPAPKHVEVTGKDGGPIESETKQEKTIPLENLSQEDREAFDKLVSKALQGGGK